MNRKLKRLSLLVAATSSLLLAFPNRTLAQTPLFNPQTEYVAGSQQGPSNIVVGDFNGDGKLDLAVTGYSKNNVSVLLGNGDGTFQAPRTFPVGIHPAQVAVGDFNGDVKPDLVVSNVDSNTISVLLGNGDGTFQAAQSLPVGLNPWYFALGDFNSDGILDLAVADYGCSQECHPSPSNTISVLLGNGDGTFQAAQNYLVDSAPVFVAVGDLNGDGKPDLAVADLHTFNISVLINNSGGSPVVATPTFSPGGGTYTGSVTVSISDAISGATIYYTTDGSTPTTSSAVYTGALTFTQTTTLKAMAAASGMTNSAVASATYTVQQQQQVATPTFSPGGGIYTGSVTVTISETTSGATVYYTTDGSTPTTSSAVYSGALTFTQTTTLKAMAAASGMTDSGVASATYTVQQQQVATPTFSPAGGTYTGSVTVTISDATSGATIHYTTDGSTPTTSSAVYSGALTFTQTTTLKAMAAANGMTNSGVASATYTVQQQQVA